MRELLYVIRVIDVNGKELARWYEPEVNGPVRVEVEQIEVT